MQNEPNDGWLDDQFSQLDDRVGPTHFAAPTAQQLADIANGDPDQFAPPPDEPVVPGTPSIDDIPVEPVAVQYAPTETVDVEGGGTLTYEEDEQGWHATLDPKNGGPVEVFHARTGVELAKQIAVGKLNASKKINQLNNRLKLVQKPDSSQPGNKVTAAPTADQIFEIKTLFQSDPFAAYNKMLEIQLGVDFNEFAKWAKAGQEASEKQKTDAVAAQFHARVPQFYRIQANVDALTDRLTETKRPFTVESLIETYNELAEAGMLTAAPRPAPRPQPAAITAPVAPTQVVPAVSAGIQRPVGRQNAVLGLRPGETTTVRPVTEPRAPSAEDLNQLPDADIDKLFADVRRAKAQSGRR